MVAVCLADTGDESWELQVQGLLRGRNEWLSPTRGHHELAVADLYRTEWTSDGRVFVFSRTDLTPAVTCRPTQTGDFPLHMRREVGWFLGLAYVGQPFGELLAHYGQQEPGHQIRQVTEVDGSIIVDLAFDDEHHGWQWRHVFVFDPELGFAPTSMCRVVANADGSSAYADILTWEDFEAVPGGDEQTPLLPSRTTHWELLCKADEEPRLLRTKTCQILRLQVATDDVLAQVRACPAPFGTAFITEPGADCGPDDLEARQEALFGDIWEDVPHFRDARERPPEVSPAFLSLVRSIVSGDSGL